MTDADPPVPCDGEGDVHIFEIEDPVTATPDDRRCACGQHTWSEMDLKLLETMWRLTT